jgi:glycosyltransferase involved in cell wall biosynthesis
MELRGTSGTKDSGRVSRPSVLILVAGTQRRGAEVVAENLTNELNQAGWRADLVALRESSSSTRIEALPLFTSDRPVSGLRPAVVWRLRKRIRSLEPDVVLAGGGATLKYSVAALLGFRRPPKLVYSSIGEPGYWARTSRSRRILAWLLSRTDHVNAVSHATARQLVEDFRVPEGKVTVTYPGVPQTMIDHTDREPSEVLRVLYLGSLSAEKNPMAALRATRLCSQPVSLRYVGDGPQMAELKKESAGLDLIEVIGPVADVKPHLLWAEVLVLTSLTEGMPGVILEAAAHGLPVVAFDVGGVREAVEDGVTGFVVSEGDVAGVAARLDLLAGDPVMRQTMGAAAQEKIISGFLLTDSVANSLKILQSVIGD